VAHALFVRSAVEMTADRAFARRVIRLAFTSAVALGVVWALARTVRQAHPAIAWLLAGGWLLMPTVLFASLSRPLLRYALVVPATLVSVALVALSVAVIPVGGMAAVGWVLVTCGVLVGGTLGLWFWFRLMPVPAALNDPFSRWRWALVGIHVMLVVSGLLLVGADLVERT
jgi:hypothetical protein